MDISCTVCTESFVAADTLYGTSCGHVFHQACLNTWKRQSPTCPQCNATYHGNPIRIFLNFSVPNQEDPLQLLESLRKCIENDKKNTIKQISDITAKLKTCEKGNEALKRQFQTELQAEQEIRRDLNEKLQTAKKNSRNYQKPYEVPNPRNDLQVKIAPGLPLNKRPAILQSEALKAAQNQRPNVNIYNQHLPTQFPQIPTIRSYPPPSNLQPSTSNQAVPLLSLIQLRSMAAQSASNNQPTSSQHNTMLQPSTSGSKAITATSLNAPADASVLQPLIDNQVDFELPNCITPIQQDPAWKQIPSGPDIMSWLDHNNLFSESPYWNCP